MNRVACIAAAFSTMALCATAALAQYPSRPVKIIVAVAAGGAPDLAARTIAARLGKPLGQPVIVENRGGANGNLAGQAVAQSPPDGYTLLLAPDSLVVINPHIYRKMPFATKDLVPVAHIIRNQFVLAVHPSVPARSLKEFVEYARKAQPPLAYASAGNGSQHHLLMELLKARAGIEMLHVPYKGGAPAVAATVAGDTLATVAGGPSTAPHVKAGSLRLIAGTSARRWELTPDLPVISELYPGYEGTVWSAVFAPAGTPEAIVSRLHAEINGVLADKEVAEVFGRSGGSMTYISTRAELAEVIRRDTEKYAKVVSDIKLTAEE
jgi:tripartite-type tricarboxylate transporter receptor subunit TctC